MKQEKQFIRNVKGITLIALVITIIVMLILAGVSLNASIGEYGIISNAQYSTFVSEMKGIEEALKIWQTARVLNDDDYEKKAPTDGLCTQNELQETERLIGEVGYYRIWSISDTKPTLDLTESNETFDSKYESEFVYYPAGVQDLYYLNNQSLGINKKKKYLIDAATGIIYSLKGIRLNGIQCYSLEMAKTVMEGYTDMPTFAELEVNSGKAAGDVSNKYKVDENGNYVLDENGNKIENSDYNPNGFQIIADFSNDNIYKLYNNGDLYAKGKKGLLLNSSTEETQKLNTYIWKNIEFSNEIPGASSGNIEVVSGCGTIYVIDSNREMWAWGSNTNNILGLSQEEQKSYTGRDVIKLSIPGSIYKVFPTEYATYVVVLNNGVYELYASGYNTYGELGIGSNVTTTNSFTKVEFSNPNKIKTVTCKGRDDHFSMILTEDGKVYFAGEKSQINYIFENENNSVNYITKYTEIFNGVYGEKFDSKIKDIINGMHYNTPTTYVLLENNELYLVQQGSMQNVIFKYEDEKTENGKVQNIWSSKGITIIKRINSTGENEFWMSVEGSTNDSFLHKATSWYTFYNMKEILADVDINNIKDIFLSTNIFILLNNGKVYCAGPTSGMGIGSSTTIDSTYYEFKELTNLPVIDKFIFSTNTTGWNKANIMLKSADGDYYVTRDAILMYQNFILQQSWKLIASNVKKFNASANDSKLGYIDFNNDLWVLGNDARYLGLNISDNIEISNFVRLKDYLKDLDIYNSLSENIEDYYMATGAMFIKTNANDNNSIYVCTRKNENYSGLPKSNEASFIELSNYTVPIKLLENIELWSVSPCERFALTYDKKLYTWGRNDGVALGDSASSIPKLYTGNVIQLDKINKIFASRYQSYLIENAEENNQKFFYTGTDHVSGNTGTGTNPDTNVTWTEFNLEKFFDGENVSNVVSSDGICDYLLMTKKGNLYVWGKNNRIGVGLEDSTIQRTAKKVSNMKNIVQITAGNGFFIAIDKDGKVYGTGSNLYGILGRWIGVDRKTPNSRYKTAFDWVECPELEI